jgi:nitrite reductase/ring-hydroxylating ferredoxin subunit
MSSLSKNANSPTTSATSIPSNWKLIPDIKTADLPDKDGEITLIDTNLDGIKDGAVNPTGAICCASFSGKLYAFKVNCSCCQVPMNKAKILPPPETGLLEAPRLSCDFCGSTFNLRTGEPVDDATKSEGAGGNMLGGMVKGLMKSRGRKPVTVYALSSDAKDRVLISL